MKTFHYVIGRDPSPNAWWHEHPSDGHLFYANLLYQVLPRRTISNPSAQNIVLIVILGSSLSLSLTGNRPLLPTLVANGLVMVLYVGVTEIAPHVQSFPRLVKGARNYPSPRREI